MSFFIDLAALVGACAWLPHIYGLLAKPKIQFYLADSANISYSAIGPQLKLDCAIAADRKDALISRIEATITHNKGDCRKFVWSLLSETQSTLMPFTGEGGGTLSRADQAVALKVLVSALAQKTIDFLEEETSGEIVRKAQALAKRTYQMKQANTEELEKKSFDSEEFHETIQFLKDNLYWKVGGYTLELRAYIDSVRRPHVVRYRFELVQSDVDALSENVEKAEAFVRARVLSHIGSPKGDESDISPSWRTIWLSRIP